MTEESAPTPTTPPPCDPEFMKLEYNALRNEILSTRERIIRIQLVGITGLPLLIGGGQMLAKSVVIPMVGPLIILIFVLVLLSEQLAMMRAGAYILAHIERALAGRDSGGWEHWLEAKAKHRLPDRVLALAGYLAFAVYYVGASYLAIDKVVDLDHVLLAKALGVVYTAGFGVGLWLFIKIFPTGTTALSRQP